MKQICQTFDRDFWSIKICDFSTNISLIFFRFMDITVFFSCESILDFFRKFLNFQELTRNQAIDVNSNSNQIISNEIRIWSKFFKPSIVILEASKCVIFPQKCHSFSFVSWTLLWYLDANRFLIFEKQK